MSISFCSQPLQAAAAAPAGANLHYGAQTALHNIALSLGARERIAILGHSGAGKSTLLRWLYQQLASRDTLAWIPQDLGLVANLSLFHNIYIGRLDHYSRWRNLRNLFWPEQQLAGECRALLDRLQLQEPLQKRAGELSGGQQQRLAIARALYRGANWLLADEPVANLDKALASQSLQALTTQFPSFVIALHDTEQALAIADRIIGIRAGHIVLDCPAAAVSDQQLAALYAPHAA